MRRTKLISLVVPVAAIALAPSVADAAAVNIGQGREPALAVDAAGTGYVTWWSSSVDSTLFFCRLQRGASACDSAAATSLPVHGDGLTPASVVVSGSRVVTVAERQIDQAAPFGPFGMFAYTSVDGGVTFDAGKVVGSVDVRETVPGPGNTLSGVEENGKPLKFQNMPLDGSSPANPDGTSAVPVAALGPPGAFAYNATVGLLDAATPVVVYQRGAGGADAAFQLYDGTGSVNDTANWTAPVGIGPLYSPQLAGGPSGLFVLGSDTNTLSTGNVIVRKFDGTTFGPAVTIGPGGGGVRGMDLFQDAGGRLHAVYDRSDTSAIRLAHAVSDDGVTWRTGDLLSYPPTIGAIVNPWVRTAPDHVGLAVGESATNPSVIAVSAVGPDAPGAAGPPPGATLPKPTLAGQGKAVLRGKKFKVNVAGEILLPNGISGAAGCTGTVKVTLLRAKKRIAGKTTGVSNACKFRITAKVKRSKVKQVKRLKVRLAFSGNAAVAPSSTKGSIPVRR